MAASSTSNILCKYYMNNACTKGDTCPFSHNPKDKPDMMCRYYQMGTCMYGNRCRYNHARVSTTASSNSVGGTSTRKIITEPNTNRSNSGRMPGPITLAVASAGLGTPSNEMVTLKKNPSWKPSEWVKAPEFVPGRSYHGSSPLLEYTPDPPPSEDSEEYFFSYSDITMAGLAPTVIDNISTDEASLLLCPFYEMTGQCPWENGCEYIHGELCDICQKYCLKPLDPDQQKEHRSSCTKQIEEEMEKAFAVQRSQGQTCGICMDVVMEKTVKSDRRFGILSGCDHCFCLGCIRKWRNSTHTNKRTIRACPMCRNVSYIVIPSEVWITDEEDKRKLMEAYRTNLNTKPCKYFNEGKGTCPFGNSCLYKHALPDGTLVESVPRIATDNKGRAKNVGGGAMLWEFIEQRNEQQWVESSDEDTNEAMRRSIQTYSDDCCS